jgi:hypothetical protein
MSPLGFVTQCGVFMGTAVTAFVTNNFGPGKSGSMLLTPSGAVAFDARGLGREAARSGQKDECGSLAMCTRSRSRSCVGSKVLHDDIPLEIRVQKKRIIEYELAKMKAPSSSRRQMLLINMLSMAG